MEVQSEEAGQAGVKWQTGVMEAHFATTNHPPRLLFKTLGAPSLPCSHHHTRLKAAMARRARLLLLLAAVAALAVAAAPVHASAGDGGDESGVGGMRRWLDGLNATDTATNRTTTGFISYDALLADNVPCSVPGASYYNCRTGAEANPYERGCSAITQCRD